jgi:dTDP-4-dehydrorhamnose 3,5-epimerase
MQFSSTSIPGAFLIEPAIRGDERGRFFRAWCSKEFIERGIDFNPVQANMGFSMKRGTTRGVHFQVAPDIEAKLVRCTRGAMFDVVLDLRSDSSTYLKWYGVELTAENGRMLFVPERCGHGYQTLQDETEMHYMASAFYAPGSAKGVRFDDPLFGIQWPLDATVVSEQDRNWPLLEKGRF